MTIRRALVPMALLLLVGVPDGKTQTACIDPQCASAAPAAGARARIQRQNPADASALPQMQGQSPVGSGVLPPPMPMTAPGAGAYGRPVQSITMPPQMPPANSIVPPQLPNALPTSAGRGARAPLPMAAPVMQITCETAIGICTGAAAGFLPRGAACACSGPNGTAYSGQVR